jgi:predicted transport protein
VPKSQIMDMSVGGNINEEKTENYVAYRKKSHAV